ncbi:MAG: hypothetical protein WCT15_06335, partial [Candidatus Omnitrophota bacterium]
IDGPNYRFTNALNAADYTTTDIYGRMNIDGLIYVVSNSPAANNMVIARSFTEVAVDEPLKVASLEVESRDVRTYRVTMDATTGIYRFTNINNAAESVLASADNKLVTIDGVVYQLLKDGEQLYLGKEYMILDNGDGRYTFSLMQNTAAFADINNDGIVNIDGTDYYIFENPASGAVTLLTDPIVHSVSLGGETKALSIASASGTASYYDVYQVTEGTERVYEFMNVSTHDAYREKNGIVRIKGTQYKITKTAAEITLEEIPVYSNSGEYGIVQVWNAKDADFRYYAIAIDGDTGRIAFTNIADPADRMVASVNNVVAFGSRIYDIGYKGDQLQDGIFLTPRPEVSANTGSPAVVIRTSSIEREDIAFDTGATNWSEALGIWVVKDGAYRQNDGQANANGKTVFNKAGFSTDGDFTLSVDITFKEPSYTMSLIGRYLGLQDYYEAKISSNNINLYRHKTNPVSGAEEVTLKKTITLSDTAVGSIVDEKTYKTVMKMEGDTILIYMVKIDPLHPDVFSLVKVLEMKDDFPLVGSGKMGLGSNSQYNKFDNVRMVVVNESRVYYEVDTTGPAYVFSNGTGSYTTQDNNSYVVIGSTKYFVTTDATDPANIKVSLSKDISTIKFDIGEVKVIPDTPGDKYSTSASGAWFTQIHTTYDTNGYAAQSGDVAALSSSYLERTVNIGTGGASLSYWWKIGTSQSALPTDRMVLIVDGDYTNEAAVIAGDSGWMRSVIQLTAGTHTLKWVYDRSGTPSGAANGNAWVDNVFIKSNNTQGFSYTTPQTFALPADYSTGLTAAWAVQNTTSHDEGGFAIMAGSTAISSSSYVEKNINLTQAAKLGFWWKLNGEATDKLKLYIDGSLKAYELQGNSNNSSGSVKGWVYVSVSDPLAAGAHTVKWVYDRSNTSSGSTNTNAWVDDVTFTYVDKIESFDYAEGQTLNIQSSDYTTGGDNVWVIQNTDASDPKGFSLKAGLTQRGSSSYVEKTVNLSANGKLDFWWKIASDPLDKIYFYVDGKMSAVISGDSNGWAHVGISDLLKKGEHKLKWVYSRVGNVTGVEQRADAWVDDIEVKYEVINQGFSIAYPYGSELSLEKYFPAATTDIATGGDNSKIWFLENSNTPTGDGFAVQAGAAEKGKTSFIQKAITLTSDSTLTFNWCVAAGKKRVRLLVNGEQRAEISGETKPNQWEEVTIAGITGAQAGTPYIIKWVYENNDDTDDVTQTGWVDDVNIQGNNIMDMGFEAVAEPLGDFTTGGTMYTEIDQAIFHSGEKSIALTGNHEISTGNAYIERTMVIPANTQISFWQKVSSWSGSDFLKFYINGVEQTTGSISGEVGWEQKQYNVTAGTRTFK